MGFLNYQQYHRNSCVHILILSQISLQIYDTIEVHLRSHVGSDPSQSVTSTFLEWEALRVWDVNSGKLLLVVTQARQKTLEYHRF